MASLTLISVLASALFAHFCNGGNHHLPNLYTEAQLAPPHHGSLVYVPVCSPACFKSYHQSHFSPCEKGNIANLPLQNHGQTYHAHLDVGAHQSLHSDLQDTVSQHLSAGLQDTSHHQHLSGDASHFSTGGDHVYHQAQNHHHGKLSGSAYHHHQLSLSTHDKHSGSASVYQQNNHHSSEQKHEIHHHGSGTSQQLFKQEYQHDHGDLSSQDHGLDHDKSEAYHKKHNVNYRFEYSVNDHKTGDVKQQKEERKGDVVNGEYSLLEADGNVRTVKYFADWKTGFHAQVHNSKKSVG